MIKIKAIRNPKSKWKLLNTSRYKMGLIKKPRTKNSIYPYLILKTKIQTNLKKLKYKIKNF